MESKNICNECVLVDFCGFNRAFPSSERMECQTKKRHDELVAFVEAQKKPQP